MSRSEDAITFGEIFIPPRAASRPAERDKLEHAFLKWRRDEMQRRYEAKQDAWFVKPER